MIGGKVSIGDKWTANDILKWWPITNPQAQADLDAVQANSFPLIVPWPA
jgi:hypothetical protein